jgi:hypothetical protein
MLTWLRDKIFGKQYTAPIEPVVQTPVVQPTVVEEPKQVTESKPARKRAAPKKTTKKTPARKKSPLKKV